MRGDLRDVIRDGRGSRPARTVYADRRVMDFGRRPGAGEPQSQVFEDGADDGRVLDAADDTHGPLTFRADQGIDLVNLPDQSRPVSPEGFLIPLWFEDAGDLIIRSRLLSFPPGDIAVMAVVTHHLLALVWDVRAHGGQPFQSGKAFVCTAVL